MSVVYLIIYKITMNQNSSNTSSVDASKLKFSQLDLQSIDVLCVGDSRVTNLKQRGIGIFRSLTVKCVNPGFFANLCVEAVQEMNIATYDLVIIFGGHEECVLTTWNDTDNAYTFTPNYNVNLNDLHYKVSDTFAKWEEWYPCTIPIFAVPYPIDFGRYSTSVLKNSRLSNYANGDDHWYTRGINSLITTCAKSKSFLLINLCIPYNRALRKINYEHRAITIDGVHPTDEFIDGIFKSLSSILSSFRAISKKKLYEMISSRPDCVKKSGIESSALHQSSLLNRTGERNSEKRLEETRNHLQLDSPFDTNSDEQKALVQLMSIHNNECDIYLKYPHKFKDHDKEKDSWGSYMNSRNVDVESKAAQMEWTTFWRKEMEDHFEESWKEKKNELIQIFKKESSDKGKISSLKTSHSQSRSSKRLSSQSPKSRNLPLNSPHHSSRHSPYDLSRYSHHDSSRHSSPDSSHCSSRDSPIYNESKLNSTSAINLCKNEEELSSTSPEINQENALIVTAIETFNILKLLCTRWFAGLSSSVRALCNALEKAHEDNTDVKEVLDKDSELFLNIMKSKLEVINDDPSIGIIQKTIFQEGILKVTSLMEKLAENEEKVDDVDVDVDCLAIATRGMDCMETVSLLKEKHSNIPDNKLMVLYLKIKKVQVILFDDSAIVASSPSVAIPETSNLNQQNQRLQFDKETRNSKFKVSKSQLDSSESNNLVKNIPFVEKKACLTEIPLDSMPDKTSDNSTHSRAKLYALSEMRKNYRSESEKK